MAIRLTNDKLRQIIKEEISKLNRKPAGLRESKVRSSFNLDMSGLDADAVDKLIKFAIRVGADYTPEIEDEDGTFSVTFMGSPSTLIKIASMEHKMHGAGFSFDPEEVKSAMY